MSQRYGNDRFWCFVEKGWETTRPIEIWQSLGNGEEEVMAQGSDKYSSEQIIDALIIADKVNDDPLNKLSKREMMFLQFVSSTCQEPWATTANNAILWEDRHVFETLKGKFNEIY